MNTILIPLILVLDVALSIYTWIIIISVVLSWLVNFNVINTQNQFVRMIGSSLHQLTEPALRRIRRIVPIFGGLDLSPIVLLLAIFFVRQVLLQIRIQLG